jgi:peptide chain release factor subunit 1
MAGTTSARGRLRRLADIRPAHGRVLSVYFDLDPAQFATAEARASQITSVCDEAERLIDAGRDDLSHDELVALREDVRRVREAFDPQTMGSGGARGLAVFACGPAGLLQIVRLSHPVESRVAIGETPDISGLLGAGERERWCVVLVSTREGRAFLGDQDGFEELVDVHDDTHGQHSKGGWSQRRYEDSVDEDRQTHLTKVNDALLALLRTRPFDRLVVGGPEPIDSEFEGLLHPYLAERLAGRVSIDVDTATPASVLEATAPVFEQRRRDREREALERLKASIGRGDGLAATGHHDVHDALVQRKVELLLLEAGAEDTEELVELAVDGSAEVLVLDDESPDLGPHGGIAALLRFA